MTAPQPPKTYGDQHKTAADIQAMPPGQREAYLDQYMSPSDRAAYLQDQAAQVGQDDHSFLGLHGMMERLKAEAAAGKTAQEVGRQNVQQATSGDVQYVPGLQPSTADYQGIKHDQLKSYVTTDLDAAQVGELSDAYHQMSSIFNQFATTLGSGVPPSQGGWEGPAAESARNYFTSLQKWADANSQNSTLASEVVYQQSTAASTAKNSMPEPIPFSWSDEVKSWASSNPFNIVDNIQKSVQKAQESQDAHDQAAQVMTSYDQGLYAAASKQPVFSEPPKFDGSSGSTSSQNAESMGSVGSGVGSVGGAAGGTGGSGGHSGGYSGGAGGGSGSLSGSLAGLTGSPSLAAGAKTGGAYNSGTSAQSYQPSNNSFTTSTPGSNANNLSTLGGMPMGPMGGLGGGGADEAYSSKLGRGAGGGSFGPGGSGSAAGSGSATGAGAQTGARAGGAGAAESAAGGARGTAGSAGRSGMGGMGGHGGKGQGGEDEEHQRPSWLIEPDPDDIFGTTERTAPPVIGE